jgi:hypothetical protein
MKKIVFVLLAMVAGNSIADEYAKCRPLKENENKKQLEFKKVNHHMTAVVDGVSHDCEFIAVPLHSIRVIEGHRVGIWAVCGEVNFLNGPWFGDNDPGFYAELDGLDYRCESETVAAAVITST